MAVVAYFDIFGYPLTAVEIWKWLWREEKSEDEKGRGTGFAAVEKILNESEFLRSRAESRRGFYFLSGREEIIEKRQERYRLADKKFKKALKTAGVLKRVPGVKMIAICNSLAWSNAGGDSDIDMFVITEPGSIWTVRFWTAGFLKLFGLRPTGKKTRDKICLSFFVDEKNMDLEKISLSEPDIYLIYWIAGIVPIYDKDGVYERFIRDNTWIKKYLPNFFPAEISERRSLAAAKISLPIPPLGEKFLRRMQLGAMPGRLKDMANRDTRVVINDSILKFHANDRRGEYRKRWQKKMEELIV